MRFVAFRVRRTAILGLAMLAVGACDALPDFLGEDDEGPPLPGQRISILAVDRGLNPDASLLDQPILLPRPYGNESWSQPGGTASHAMYHLELGDVPKSLWRVDIGEGEDDDSRILAQPLVVNGVVYTMDALSTVSAFDAATGRRIWEVDLELEDEDEGYFGGGLAYEAGRLFVGTGFARVFALEARSGEVIWVRKAPGPLRNGPAVLDGRLYILTPDNQVQALATDDGRLLWNNVGVEENANVLGAAAPAVTEKIAVVPYSSGQLLGIRVDSGRVVWSENLSAYNRLDPLADIPQIRGLPVVDRDRVFAISHAGRMVSLDLERGLRVWDIDLAGTETPWVAGDFIFVVTGNSEVVALKREDGRVRWVSLLPRYEDPEEQEDPIRWQGPVLAGNRLIVTGSDGSVLTLSPYNGEVLGAIELPDAAAVPPVVVDRTLYFVTTDGDLLAMR